MLQELADDVINRAEAARDSHEDLVAVYGALANPEGTSATSSQIGDISGFLIPTHNGLPVGQLSIVTPEATSPDHGVPCMHRNDTRLVNLPLGAVVVQGASVNARYLLQPIAQGAAMRWHVVGSSLKHTFSSMHTASCTWLAVRSCTKRHTFKPAVWCCALQRSEV